MASITIVWICMCMLAVIFLIAVMGIIRANKANQDAMALVGVVCAGSVDKTYPASVRIKLPHDPLKSKDNVSKTDFESLLRFVVKGNSMQYANINSNDLVYVKPMDIEGLKENLPKVTLLSFVPKHSGSANRKIRRTWSILKSDISDKEFNDILDGILNGDRFKELKNSLGYKCPSNEELKSTAINRLSHYRHSHGSSGEELLLSTTFRTENDRIEFSIHPASSLQGVIAYVSHPVKPYDLN